MLEETLKWRSTYKPEEIRCMRLRLRVRPERYLEQIFMTAMEGLFLSSDLESRTRHQSMDNQIRHLVYLIKNAILNLPEGQEQMAWLIDFTNWFITNNVPIKSARDTVNILQNHYPERLAVAFLYSPPRIFEAFWKVCFQLS